MADSSSNGGMGAREAIRAARQVAHEVLGKAPESVTGVSRTEQGWTVSLDLLEMSRIPPSTDLLATYDVSLDRDGELVDLVRSRRYLRSQAGDQ